MLVETVTYHLTTPLSRADTRSMETPRLVELIDAHKHAYGVSESELARRVGITRQNLHLWRTHGLRGLPARTTP